MSGYYLSSSGSQKREKEHAHLAEEKDKNTRLENHWEEGANIDPAVETKGTITETPAPKHERIQMSSESEQVKTEYSQLENERAVPEQTPCDEIIFRNGDILSAKVEEISPEEIKYRKCDHLDGPLYTCEKTDVFMIRYSNGKTEVFKQAEEQVERKDSSETNNTYDGPRRADPVAIFGFVCSLASLLILPFVLGALGIIFGTISLARQASDPQRYSGKALAIAALVIGIISVVYAIVVVAAL